MAERQLSRNSLCPCGSGKKYKKCCISSTFQPTPMPTFYTSPPPQPRVATTPKKPVDDLLQASLEGVPEYVFVKGKGLTHKNDLKPRGECKLRDGEWAIFRPDLVNGHSVFVKDKGWIPVDELKPGDQYEHDGVWVTFQPERVIGTTEEHPFFVKDKGWTPAGELKEGDLLRTVDGWVPVTGLEHTGRYETVYNLKVADYHTYFVGSKEWGFAVWAHNSCLDVKPIGGGKYGLFNKDGSPFIEKGATAQRAFDTQEQAAKWLDLASDPAVGKVRPDEAATALRVEKQEGVDLKRYTPPKGGKGDWVDSKGIVYDGCSPAPSAYFDKQWTNFTNSLNDHLAKVDKVVVDLTDKGLSPAQTTKVTDYIDGLAPALKNKVILLK
jgi:hypothetical protein